jgi:hypothetical protein
MPYAVLVQPDNEIVTLDSELTLEFIQETTGFDTIAVITLEHGLIAMVDDESVVNNHDANAPATFAALSFGFDIDATPSGWLCGNVLFAAQHDDDGNRPALNDEQMSVLRSYLGF